MSTLIVHEAGMPHPWGNPDHIRQLITVGEENLQVYAIRPHLYKHLAPAGSAYMQIQDVNGKRIADSEQVALSSIASGSGAESYFHGYVRFLIDVALKAETQYYVALKWTGAYAFSESAYFGWCTDFDLRKTTPDFSVPRPVGLNAPFDFEMWVRRRVSNGVYP